MFLPQETAATLTDRLREEGFELDGARRPERHEIEDIFGKGDEVGLNPQPLPPAELGAGQLPRSEWPSEIEPGRGPIDLDLPEIDLSRLEVPQLQPHKEPFLDREFEFPGERGLDLPEFEPGGCFPSLPTDGDGCFPDLGGDALGGGGGMPVVQPDVPNCW